jgi:hypothetical protein
MGERSFGNWLFGRAILQQIGAHAFKQGEQQLALGRPFVPFDKPKSPR